MDGLERWALAAAAGTLSEAVTYPLDLIKTRLQLQNERGRALSGEAARGALTYSQMFLHVARTEGVRALFAGCGVAVVRQVFNAGVSVALYPSVRAATLSEGETAATAPLWKRAAAGALTGGLGQALANPADVVKVRVQADGRGRLLGVPPRYAGAVDCARQIAASEGLPGFYAALRSSVWRGAVINSAGIASYDATKQVTLALVGGEGVLPQLVGSLVTGVVTAVVSTPLDVVKTRLMANPGAYASPTECLATLVRTEGLVSMVSGGGRGRGQGGEEGGGCPPAPAMLRTPPLNHSHPCRPPPAAPPATQYKGLVPTYKRQALFNFVFWMSLEELQAAVGAQRL